MFGLSTLTAWLLAGLLASSLIVSAVGGWKVRDAFCDAAEAKTALAAKQAEINKMKTELDAYKIAATAGQQAVDVIAELKRNQDDKFRELQDTLAKAPPGTVCLADDGVIGRLRGIPR